MHAPAAAEVREGRSRAGWGALSTELRQVRAFSYEGECFDYGDVVEAAVDWGEWQRFSAGLEGPAVSPVRAVAREDSDALHAAVVRFRRAHGLLAGDEYQAWLTERELGTADLEAHLLGRSALDARGMRAELILGGALRRWSQRLAAAAAAARALEIAVRGLPSAVRRERLLVAEFRFRAAHLGDAALTRCIASHRIDWQCLEWDEVVTDSEGAALEAALWFGSDHLDLAAVAALAGCVPRPRSALRCALAQADRALLGAVPGEMVGPLPASDGQERRLLVLRGRTAPVPAAPGLRARAEAELLTAALEPHLAGRVRWHVEL